MSVLDDIVAGVRIDLARREADTTPADLRAALADAPRPVGLVPTMGWLHAGHVSLVERARAESATVVMSIFVNPMQFGEAADFERYPRNEARDLERAEAAGVDLVFAPSVDEVYPPGFDTTVSVGAIAGPLEGAARPGHFDGVATVVAILFALVGAERAYFGLKDYQQVRVIRRMALDLALPTTVVPCATVREPDGLAMSSRNARLTPEGRAAAPVLRRALLAGADAIRAGEADAEVVRAVMGDVLAAEPAAMTDYVSVADADTLAELDAIPGEALLSLAVRIEGVRLIDNERVVPEGSR
jgi:pantoate--beta-alanine ligase